jgi:helix-turn-helix protein
MRCEPLNSDLSSAKRRNRAKSASPRTYTIDQVAERWNCSSSTVLSHIYDGTLRAFDISTNPSKRSRWIVPAEALEEFEANRTFNATPVAKPPKRKKLVRGHVIEFYK